jgi:hypothetical protein
MSSTIEVMHEEVMHEEGKEVTQYAHHVKCVIEYRGVIGEKINFETEENFSNWFKNGIWGRYYMNPNEDVFNFKYKTEFINKPHRKMSNIVVEFDTNKDEDNIIYEIFGALENNGNYQNKQVFGEVIDDSIYITNTEFYC